MSQKIWCYSYWSYRVILQAVRLGNFVLIVLLIVRLCCPLNVVIAISISFWFYFILTPLLLEECVPVHSDWVFITFCIYKTIFCITIILITSLRFINVSIDSEVLLWLKMLIRKFPLVLLIGLVSATNGNNQKYDVSFWEICTHMEFF